MKLAIHLEANYRYDEPVSFSTHFFRLFPRLNRSLRLISSDFQTNAGATVLFQRDLFDNEAAKVFYPERGHDLQVSLRLQLEVEERNPFAFLLDESALNVPVAYTAAEQQMLAPYLQFNAPCPLPFWTPPTFPTPTVPLLIALNSALHDHLAYESRELGAPRSPAETLQLRSASCRDFMVLHAEVLRTLGLATRLVSGYVCELESTERRADGAMHAWTEVYLPGAGWIGLDPTNGSFCNHNHIATAVGLTPADITPIDGNYFSDHPVNARMDSSVQLQHLT